MFSDKGGNYLPLLRARMQDSSQSFWGLEVARLLSYGGIWCDALNPFSIYRKTEHESHYSVMMFDHLSLFIAAPLYLIPHTASHTLGVIYNLALSITCLVAVLGCVLAHVVVQAVGLTALIAMALLKSMSQFIGSIESLMGVIEVIVGVAEWLILVTNKSFAGEPLSLEDCPEDKDSYDKAMILLSPQDGQLANNKEAYRLLESLGNKGYCHVKILLASEQIKQGVWKFLKIRYIALPLYFLYNLVRCTRSAISDLMYAQINVYMGRSLSCIHSTDTHHGSLLNALSHFAKVLVGAIDTIEDMSLSLSTAVVCPVASLFVNEFVRIHNEAESHNPVDNTVQNNL